MSPLHIFLFSKTTIDKEKVKKKERIKNEKVTKYVQSKFAKSLMLAGLSEPGVQVKT